MALAGVCLAEYFSWSIFRLTSPNGQVILTNPFVTNPDSPAKVEDFPKVEAAFKTSGMPVTVIKPEFKKVYELTK